MAENFKQTAYKKIITKANLIVEKLDKEAVANWERKDITTEEKRIEIKRIEEEMNTWEIIIKCLGAFIPSENGIFVGGN